MGIWESAVPTDVQERPSTPDASPHPEGDEGEGSDPRAAPYHACVSDSVRDGEDVGESQPSLGPAPSLSLSLHGPHFGDRTGAAEPSGTGAALQ